MPVSPRVIEPVVLNAGDAVGAPVPLSRLAVELRGRLASIVASHADPTRRALDYRGLAASPEFASLVELARHLRAGRPHELATADQQIAFWANLYNALTMHAIIALGIRDGIADVQDFFKQPRYDVGGQSFDLLDVEHGVLRQNRISLNMPTAVWETGDPRSRWIVDRLDPRVHFALMCGARSCPPIRAYQAERLDAQLELAARAFVDNDVEVDPEAGRVRLSRLFHWYQQDFGDVLGWILNYLDPGPARDWLAEHRQDAQLEYRHYDWQLNDIGRPGMG